MPVTPNLGLPYPILPDSADVPRDIQALAERLDELLGGLGSIPGEIKCWSGLSLPSLTDYGRWAWCDGAVYAIATYPRAASNLAPAWRTAHGLPDPGAGNFRAPDLRGFVLAALDRMPNGARANRITRSQGENLGAAGGEEYHTLSGAEMPYHGHDVGDPTHVHYTQGSASTPGGAENSLALGPNDRGDRVELRYAGTGVWVSPNGGGGAHENLQPTIFVPYIVKLDD